MLTKVRFKEVAMQRIVGATGAPDRDFLAAEVPLEIRVESRSVAVVMRTPGDDPELAADFLVTEGLVRQAADIADIRHVPHCLRTADADARPSGLDTSEGNVIAVGLAKPENFDPGRLDAACVHVLELRRVQQGHD